MKNATQVILLVFAVVAGAATRISAAVVYDNGTYNAAVSPYGMGAWDDSSDARGGSDIIMADDFSLGSPLAAGTSVKVTWWGWYNSVYQTSGVSRVTPDDFRIQLYTSTNNSPTRPNAFLFSEHVGNVMPTFTGDYAGRLKFLVYQASATITLPQNLAAGTNYYVSIFDNTPITNPPPNDNNNWWRWAETSAMSGDSSHASSSGSLDSAQTGWSWRNAEMAFRLESVSVPEPPAFVHWASLAGVVAVVWCARRLRKRNIQTTASPTAIV